MRCPEVNTLFHLWINYICRERRLQRPAMWSLLLCFLPLKPSCLFSCHVFLPFHLEPPALCLCTSLPASLRFQHLHLSVPGLWAISSSILSLLLYTEISLYYFFSIFFQIWQAWKLLEKTRSDVDKGGPKRRWAPSLTKISQSIKAMLSCASGKVALGRGSP